MATGRYAPRHAQEAVLYQVVAGQFETFLARANDRNRPPPRFVEREFRRFLECGIFAHGFLRVHCERPAAVADGSSSPASHPDGEHELGAWIPPMPQRFPTGSGSRNYSWAELMRRVFEVDVLECPDCQGRMRILAAIHPPQATRAILECLDLPSRAPPVARPEPAPNPSDLVEDL